MSDSAKLHLFRDGELIQQFDDWLGVLAYIHKHHSYSADWAFKYEGYELRTVGN